MKKLLIIASGPSADEVDYSLFGDYDTLTVNHPSHLWPTTFYYSVDARILQNYYFDLARYDGTIFSTNKTPVPMNSDVVRINYVHKHGWSDEKYKVFGPFTSTYGAMQLALQLGYDKIVVVGIDQGFDDRMYSSDIDGLIDPDVRRSRFASEVVTFGHMPDSVREKFLFVSSINRHDWFLGSNHCSPEELQENIL